MRLAEAISEAGYDSQWAIYAEAPFTPESEARYGQNYFENGGLLDGKEWVGNCDMLTSRAEDELTEYLDDEDYEEILSNNIEEFLIPALEEERQEREDLNRHYDERGKHIASPHNQTPKEAMKCNI